MFWRFGYNGNQQLPNIDNLLDEEGITLLRILLEEDCIQEIKTNNQKLINFIITKKAELIDFLFMLYNATEERRHDDQLKASFVAGEVILTGQVDLMIQVLNSDEVYAKLYKSLIETGKDQMVPLLANNIYKLVATLANYNPAKFLDFLQSKEEFMPCLISHIQSTGILDTLLKLMTCNTTVNVSISSVGATNETISMSIADFLHEKNIISKVVQLFDPIRETPDTHSLASICLIEMITLYHTSDDLDEELLNKCILIKDLKSNETVEQLCQFMFQSAPNEEIHDLHERRNSVVINSINVLIELIRRSTCSSDYDIQQFNPVQQQDMSFSGELAALPPPPPNIKRAPLETSELIAVLLKYLPSFKDLLTHNVNIKPIPTTMGVITPLTSARLTVTELFAELLRVQTQEVFKIFLETHIFETCFDLFFEFSWNNLLHMVVCDLCVTILDSDMVITEGIDYRTELIKGLFLNVKIISRILEAVRKNSAQEYQKGGTRIGYMGHLGLIVGKILEFVEYYKDTEIFNQIKHVFTDEWDDYIRKGYKQMKDKETKTLGSNNKQNAEIGVDIDTDQLARYMVSRMVAGMPDLFGDKNGLTFENDNNAQGWNNLDDPFAVSDIRGSSTQRDSDDDSDDDPFKTSQSSSDPFSSFNTTETKPVSNNEDVDPFGSVKITDSDNSGWANFDKLKESINDNEKGEVEFSGRDTD